MKRKVEIYSAGCSNCEEIIALVKSIACDNCEICICDMHDANVAAKAKTLGINKVPTIVVDDIVASCCKGIKITEEELRKAGIGEA